MSRHSFKVCAVVCSTLMTLGCGAMLRAEENPPQEMISLPVKVVNEDGQPVAGVKIIPWALRSSQGHGQWPEKVLGQIPEDVTNADGHAEVFYPRYKIPGEFVRTTEVTLSVNHPDYVYISHEGVNIPRETEEPHTITVKRGGNLEVLPTLDGKPLNPKEVYAIWSDARSWQKDSTPQVNSAGRLVIPSMAPGTGQLLLARVEDGKTTHFSSIHSVELKAGETQWLELPLVPSANITGRLSDDVPRPIRNGRIVAQSLLNENSMMGVSWSTWAAVAEDGTFVIEGWPADQAGQLISLSDGYIAKSGAVPEEEDHPRSGPDPFQRPQVFRPDSFDQPIVMQMEPMAQVLVTVVDDQEKPVIAAKVISCPNVCWWNGGSQVYCDTLFRSVDFMLTREYQADNNNSYPLPFATETDEQGVAHLSLPADKSEGLYVQHDQLELPISRGRRVVAVKPVAGETNEIRLALQPKGKEFLGEWDKLAGVLFGCTGEECRRLLEDPGFRERITAVRVQLDQAEDTNDPNLLKNAFAEISAAFDEVGDQEEVARWRRKADEQAAKLKAK